MRFLIVDDEPEILMLVRANVQAMGHECDVADNAADALAACTSPARRPDVMLLDVAMPDVDGAELLGRIRDTGCEPTHVLLLSAILPEELAALAAELGVGHLSKPFTAAGFRDAISRVLETAP